MDEHRTKSEDRRSAGTPRALRRQRQKLLEAASTRRQQIDELEVRLAKEMSRVSAEMRQAAGGREGDSAALADALSPHAEQLGRLRDELKQLHNSFAASQQQALKQQRSLAEQFEEQQAELNGRRQEIEQAEARLREAQRQAEQAPSSEQADSQQLAAERQRLANLEQELAAQKQKLADQLARTAAQRRKLAQELKAERAAQHKAHQQRQAELEAALSAQQSEAAAARTEARAGQEQLRQQQTELTRRAKELEGQRAQFEQDRQRLEEKQSQLLSARSEIERQRTELDVQRDTIEQQRIASEQGARCAADDVSRTQNQRQRIARELKSQRDAQRKDLDRLRKELAHAHAAQTAQLDAALGETRRELEQVRRQQAELTRRGEELAEAETRHQADQRRLATVKAELEVQRTQLAEQSRTLADGKSQLDLDRQQLVDLEARTRSQRQLLARELRAQRAMRRQELQRLKAERALCAAHANGTEAALAESRLERENLRQQRDEQARLLEARTRELETAAESSRHAEQARSALDAECQRLKTSLAEAAATRETIGELQRELEQSRTWIAELERSLAAADESRLWKGQAETAQGQLETAQSALQAERQRLADAESMLSQQEQQLAEWEKRCQGLNDELAQAQELASQAPKTPPVGQADEELRQRLADLEQRYKMALDDLRGERTKAVELERKLAQGSKSVSPAGGGGLDWEAQKRELMRRLSEECEDDGPQQKAERLKIEEVIETTDRVVAEKDRELDDLRRVLEEQSHNWGSMAVGAAAVADILDKEEIIRQERENLQKLQEEWQAKLRQAEIDISVERAKIARERMEIDEKTRDLQSQAKPDEPAPPGDAGDKAKTAKGSRWLKHLGLSDKG